MPTWAIVYSSLRGVWGVSKHPQLAARSTTLTSITIRYFDNQMVVGLSYSLIFSRAKIQLEVGASLQHLSYDES